MKKLLRGRGSRSDIKPPAGGEEIRCVPQNRKRKSKTGCRTLVPFKGAVFDVAVSTGLPLPFLKHRSGSSRSLSFRNATNCSKPILGDEGRVCARPDSYACSPISPSVSSRVLVQPEMEKRRFSVSEGTQTGQTRIVSCD